MNIEITYKSSEFKMTHPSPANRWSLFSRMVFVVLFPGLDVGVVMRFYFCDNLRTDGRTDTLCDNNDHLFGRGLVGQK